MRALSATFCIIDLIVAVLCMVRMQRSVGAFEAVACLAVATVFSVAAGLLFARATDG